jgi:thiamine kinase-like enzyme
MWGIKAADADPRLPAALARVVPHLGLPAGAEPMVRARLGGLTNANYLLEAAGERFVLRLPGAGTADYIDRAAEAHAARAAAAVGVSPEVVFCDAAEGVLLCRYVEGGVTMSAAGFRNRGSIRRAAAGLHMVHREAPPFATQFEVFTMIDAYLAVLARRNAPELEGYGAARAKAEQVRAVLAAHPGPLAPCHCDPLAENFIDTGSAMFVVDWEYAGNNDPMWDLGDLAVEAGFDAEQEAILLDTYFNGAVPPAEHGRMVLYKGMADLLWTLWGLIQHVDGNPSEDFWAYATGRFARCQALMASDAFEAALRAAASG